MHFGVKLINLSFLISFLQILLFTDSLHGKPVGVRRTPLILDVGSDEVRLFGGLDEHDQVVDQAEWINLITGKSTKLGPFSPACWRSSFYRTRDQKALLMPLCDPYQKWPLYRYDIQNDQWSKGPMVKGQVQAIADFNVTNTAWVLSWKYSPLHLDTTTYGNAHSILAGLIDMLNPKNIWNQFFGGSHWHACVLDIENLTWLDCFKIEQKYNNHSIEVCQAEVCKFVYIRRNGQPGVRLNFRQGKIEFGTGRWPSSLEKLDPEVIEPSFRQTSLHTDDMFVGLRNDGYSYLHIYAKSNGVWAHNETHFFSRDTFLLDRFAMYMTPSKKLYRFGGIHKKCSMVQLESLGFEKACLLLPDLYDRPQRTFAEIEWPKFSYQHTEERENLKRDEIKEQIFKKIQLPSQTTLPESITYDGNCAKYYQDIKDYKQFITSLTESQWTPMLETLHCRPQPENEMECGQLFFRKNRVLTLRIRLLKTRAEARIKYCRRMDTK